MLLEHLRPLPGVGEESVLEGSDVEPRPLVEHHHCLDAAEVVVKLLVLVDLQEVRASWKLMLD